jgi:dienelactone hydrolase
LPPLRQRHASPGVRARLIPNVNGLTLNILEAGFETPGRPLVLMLHGFPNLASRWRKVMPALAAAGYYAVAPIVVGLAAPPVGTIPGTQIPCHF